MGKAPDTYYRVYSRIWSEPWDEPTKHLALYVLTCEHRTTEGLFKLPIEYVRADLKWSRAKVERCLRVLIDDLVVDYEWQQGIMLILKALKAQRPVNPNQLTAAWKLIATVPPSRLDAELQQLAEQFAPKLAQKLAQQLPQRFGQPLAPALTPAPPQDSSSSSSPGKSPPVNGADLNDDDEAEALQQHLENQGYDPRDVATVVHRWSLKKRFGEPVRDPGAWCPKVLETMREARASAEAGPKIREIDGATMQLVGGQWQELVT